ncbi:retrotransposon protein, putative, ty1-copia subclass [Tanacetum coccineum]
MHNLVPNNNSIYNVSNKRFKRNLDSTYLWHCHLAHINKKRIKQLQQDGLLKSTDDESFDQCESCLSGKMTKKPFPHSNERAKDLLRIIHTDVCGPLRHVSRQGASYFITFTDDYSRYGYVYLLKHKHEVFETFKVFKNEVENQLGKTIKAIRSESGGWRIYKPRVKIILKANGIVTAYSSIPHQQHNECLRDKSNFNLTWYDLNESYNFAYNLWDYARVWDVDALVKRDNARQTRKQGSVIDVSHRIPKETMGYYFYFPPENKMVVTRYAEFFEKRLINQEINWRAVDLEEIQEKKDTLKFLKSLAISSREHLSGTPEGFMILINHPRKVCKLKRSIYGLKQASRSWNKRFDEEIKRFGFAQNLDEPCVYQKASESNVTFLILYVDDIIIMGNHIPSLQSVKDYLGSTELRVECYCDAGFETDRDDMKSQTGYGYFTKPVMEAVWIRKYYLRAYVISQCINELLICTANNSAAVHYANEPGVQRGARHYLRKYHYVRESVALGGIKILKVHTDNNLADPFTKALSNRKLTQHARSMGLHPASSFM